MIRTIQRIVVALIAMMGMVNVMGNTVPVHDPSIVICYKDGQGNSYPEQASDGSRTKYYYIFGTQLAGAYSRDMLNWTEFTPSFKKNGVVTDDYMNVFAEDNSWSRWTTNAKVRENLWAPDIIYNKEMKKWCLYFSLNGDDWLSSIMLLTSDKIEGPYERVGSVVFGGMDNKSSGVGNEDYKRVTGEKAVAARYMPKNDGNWNGTYGVSCIDPCVMYDEDGKLWMIYGSWSGGIFVIKLDEKTGLRDLTYNYGYTVGSDGASWQGTRLRYDPYMGVHIAGGYYVSGEGSYIEYIKDPITGKGYYYLFISMGFYSPEGGYTMRVYRSESVTGVFTDVTGDDAVFRKYELNYGDNTTYGVAIMQNYSWNWWKAGDGQTAQGHNSVLMDEDGRTYLIYHTKDNTGNGYGWHHVETHPLVFASDGWPLAAPFEARITENKGKETFDHTDLMGEWSVIIHSPVDYKNLACNKEIPMSLNADKTLTGAFTGTWSFDPANGGNYLTLSTTVGTFNAVVLEQRIEDRSQKTIVFTGMNPANELCVWGYRQPKTTNGTKTVYSPDSMRIGKVDFSMAWDETESFNDTTVEAGDFRAEYNFKVTNAGVNNWDNWSLWMDAGNGNMWSLRADAYSINTFEGSTVKYGYDWKWDDFLSVFNGKNVKLVIERAAARIDVTAVTEDGISYGATCYDAPTSAMKIMLGGESCYLDLKDRTISKMKSRETVGSNNADGTYGQAFNSVFGGEMTYKGDFTAEYKYHNYHSYGDANNWNNFILRNVIGSSVGLIRADRYQMDCAGTMEFEHTWGEDWAKFREITTDCEVKLNIERRGDVIKYVFDMTAPDGENGVMTVTQSGITEDEVKIGFTLEKSVVDILSVTQLDTVYTKNPEIHNPSSDIKNEIADDIKIYPTVVSDYINIEIEKDADVVIYSADGKEVYSGKMREGVNTINARGWTKGVYSVVVRGDKMVVKKVMK